MKQLLLAATAALALAISCSKQNDEQIAPIATDTSTVTLTLTDTSDTRTFFDAAAKAEAWESTLSSLTVFTFDASGNLLLKRVLTPAELTAKTASFALPKSAAGTTCSFYAVANLDATSVMSKAQLLALVESSAALYNGTFAEVTTKARRAGGFAMSGMSAKAVGATGTTTQVGITLRRTVAKVAVQASIDPAFASKYSGTLTVNSVKVIKAASQSPVVAGAAPTTGSMSYTHTQTPGTASGKYNALFYLFENGALNSGSRVALEISATYDLDGNAATTADRSEVVYTVELAGKAGGEILRNGYYRVAANISGLVGQECQISISVADWETPITQSVDLGA